MKRKGGAKLYKKDSRRLDRYSPPQSLSPDQQDIENGEAPVLQISLVCGCRRFWCIPHICRSDASMSCLLFFEDIVVNFYNRASTVSIPSHET